MKKIIFRFDSGTQYGLGHWNRCRALADYLAARGDYSCVFAVREIHAPQAVGRHRLARISSETEFIHSIAPRFDVAVIDHYGYQQRHFQALATHPRLKRVIWDDENNRGNLHAHIIINPSAAFTHQDYCQQPSSCRLLIGTRYVALRQEFSCCHLCKAQKKYLLLMFGGSDPRHLSLKVLRLLVRAGIHHTIPIVLVSTHLCPDLRKIRALCERYGILHIHNSDHISQWMARSRFAVSAGGGSSFELLAMRVITLLIVVADNQYAHTQALASSLSLPWFDARKRLDAKALLKSIQKLLRKKNVSSYHKVAKMQIDTLGCQRIMREINALLSPQLLTGK